MPVAASVSLIIPTLNRGAVLVALLENIANLESVRENQIKLEVVIVDQSDHRFSAVDRFSSGQNFSLQYIHLKEKGLPNARNVAMAHATGEICIFIDDDVVLQERFLEEHILAFNEGNVGAVAGKVVEDAFIKSLNTATPPTMYGINNFGKYYPLRGGTTRNFVFGFPGGNFSIRKSLYQEIGPFDLRYAGTSQLEETDYAYRIRKRGYRIVFNPDAVLLHLRVPAGGCRVPSLSEKRFWRFHNSTLFFLKHKKPFALPFMVVALSAGGFVEMLKRKYSLMNYLWSLKGFVKGYKVFSNKRYASPL